MGDRISIQFKTEDDLSVVLFSHWDGKDLIKVAKSYAQKLMNRRSGSCMPLDRFEPNTVMVDFMRVFFDGCKVEKTELNYYLASDENGGDNSDNGHYIIEFIPQTRKIKISGGDE
jgi:hypothetical protein